VKGLLQVSHHVESSMMFYLSREQFSVVCYCSVKIKKKNSTDRYIKITFSKRLKDLEDPQNLGHYI
jgi:hypothetical protein